MASMADTMPELVLVAETDPAAARRARRLAGAGGLKRLYPSIYTSNVESPPESIVLRHWQAIVVRKSQSSRQRLLRRTGTCHRELAGRIRTDTRPASSPRPGHYGHVCGRRNALVQLRRRPHSF